MSAPAQGGRTTAPDPTCRALGIAVEAVGPGRSRARMLITQDMLNAHGTAHGGYLFLLADAAFASASNSHGPLAVAQSAQITFLRPAEAGDDLVAEAVERARGGRYGVYDVTVRGPADMIIAEFRGHGVMRAAAPGKENNAR
ncbi:hydroxyphenylacetyl-CoA thioesterase PaaI [Streptomyces sp. NPDC051940]|uniref:hydroxyphenylacetyl-CoA thioesterase PaaI n=1 Tax=Streptomyces sp. NPDC051940 TaxID=3155675 RepID=UPI0034234466